VDYLVWRRCNKWNGHKISARMRANLALGLADPGHVESSDRSAAKKTDDGYQGKGCSCQILSELNACANDCCYCTV